MSTHDPLDREVRLPTLRDLAAPIFRHRRAGLASAFAVLMCTAIMVLLSPKQYESEMKLLVKRERADTIVSARPDLAPQVRTDVTEDELNSEVELLKSSDLLAQVAAKSGLLDTYGAAGSSEPQTADERAAIERAVRSLKSTLKIAPLKKTTFIKVTYRALDPALAARVLDQLAALYLEKHVTLHRPPGAYQFFSEQAQRFHNELTAAEAQLKEYGRREHVISAEIEKATVLQQLGEYQTSLQQARGQLAELMRRTADLDGQIAATPARQTTQIRTADNADLMRELKSRILNLEMTRAEMLRKFTPTYPPVVEVEEQLIQARAALERAQQAPITEEITDQNPTHQWLRSELARIRTERAAATARESSLAASVRLYEQKARVLEDHSAAQQHLKRSMKTAEDNYLLYLRKQEEARISDALDRSRIANVAIAEPPTVPTLPSASGRSLMLMLGCVMSVLIGLCATYILDYVSPYFHTPRDVESTLHVPVLAALRARD